jgi:tetratricopeptide (TPR) repeat protein
VVLNVQGKISEAEAMYQKALEADPKNALAMCHLARLYQDKALAMTTGFFSNQDEESLALFEKALQYYEKASQLTEKPEELSRIYYQWAIALAVKRDYRGAWEKVHLCKKNGGQSIIEEGFIRQLSSDMPDPEFLKQDG